MDQPRKKSFISGFISRSTDAHLRPEILPTSTAFSNLDLSDDKKGALGLTTLYAPPARAVADIVFVHGLGGGSRKTWSKSPEARHFWPQAWLPNEPDFQDVRIHSFGYKADWSERPGSILGVHDFARSLVGELKNNPALRRDSTRIILVGHSMGGCVVKKAYVLACQDQTCKDLAERMHSMFFLGTPHRGSDMAVLLGNILTATFSSKKPFVKELKPNSDALSEINEEFRHWALGLRMWSFYETLPTGSNMMSRIVVEKHSATLSYPNEEIAAVNADHRHLCKFDSPDDPNYKMLRNALVTAVDMIRATPPEAGLPRAGVDSTELRPWTTLADAEASARLRSLLGACDSMETHLATLQGLKEPGSCLWFTEGPSFSSWKTGSGPRILWLVGRPATGKSIISSHVVEQLKSPHTYCSYFFYGNSSTAGKSTTLGDCFKSLAFQMAMQDSTAREKLLQLESEGLVWDKNDDASVWRKLFVGGLFKLPSLSRHFWVIDGLDECTSFNALFSKRFLITLPDEIRLFATSRSLEAIERGLASLGSRATVCTLSDLDTLADMRLFLTTKLRELDRLESQDELGAMCDKILEKSSGSFLWVRLVLQEFEDAWTEEAMEAVLSEVPARLHDLYSRMVRSIEADPRKTPLARSILTCVVLAARPLTVEELRCVVQLDLNQTLQNMGKAVPNLCGQLVYVGRDDRVYMTHETVREFLQAEDLSSTLAVRRSSHARLASLLLRHLCSGVLKPQQAKNAQHGARPLGFAKPAATTAAAPASFPLLNYACRFFSEHVYRCSSVDDGVADDLYAFLKGSNVLALIEHFARSKDLEDIPRIAMNLRGYLGRRLKYVPPTDALLSLLEGWVTDLIRVSAKFRSQLLACPSSIHCLIPPLCPSDSIISRKFGSGDPRSSAFVVEGISPAKWDDCLIRMDFQKGQTSAVSHGDRFFAVGLSSGQISLYNTDSFQPLVTMAHPERVKGLQFSRDDQFLASCGNKNILVWDPKSGASIYEFSLPSPPLAVVFLEAGELLCALQSSELIKWSLDTGLHESISWRSGGSDFVPDQPPTRAAFLAMSDEVLIAIGYRSHPVVVWNALELRPLGLCLSAANNGIDDMVFNPNPEITALAVSYNDGRLCVFDYTTLALTTMLPNVFAQSMACSLDGRSLVTGSSYGVIDAFEFNQDRDGNIELFQIYRIRAGDDLIRGVAFSSDGLRFVDVRGQQCRVWAPAALVRMNSELESTSDAVTLPTISSGMLDDDSEDPEITSNLAASSDGRCIVAGKRGGSVVLLSTAKGSEAGVLYKHARGVSIVFVALGEARNLIVSADDSGRVLVAELPVPISNAAATARLPGQKLTAARIVLERRSGRAVTGLLLNAAANRLLVSGRTVDELWELSEGDVPAPEPLLLAHHLASASGSSSSRDGDAATTTAATTSSTRSSFQHPTNRAWFVTVAGDVARVFCWEDFAQLTSSDGIRLERPLISPPETPLAITGAASQFSGTPQPVSNVSYHVGSGVVVEFLQPSPSGAPRLQAWAATAFDPSSLAGSASPLTEPNLDAIGPAVFSVLGFAGPSTIVFLDVNLWVCSTELQSVAAPGVARSAGSGAGSFRLSVPAPPPTFHARRHFFALSEWRTAMGELSCALVAVPTAPTAPTRGGYRDVVFANGHRIVVVKGGMEFLENVTAVGRSMMGSGRLSEGGARDAEGGRTNGQHAWELVSGSMHRRASNW